MIQLVEFKKRNGALVIRILPDCRAEVEEIEDRDSDNAFLDLIESQICNGWTLINPKDVGALTDALIITDDCDFDDSGDLTRCGRVYSNIAYYQVESDIARLLRLGELVWMGVE